MQDFSAMAQGQQQLSEEDLKEASLGAEDVEALGMPSGEDKESIKQRFSQIFQEAGLMEMFQTPADQQKFTQLLDQLAEDMLNQDIQAVQNNPLFQILEQALSQGEQAILADEGTGGPVPQQAQPEAAPTKDFASMMPTPGGGLPGR